MISLKTKQKYKLAMKCKMKDTVKLAVNQYLKFIEHAG